MEKIVCLEIAEICSELPPVYNHPYHKFKIPARRFNKKSVKDKIQKLNKIRNVTLDPICYDLDENTKFKTIVPLTNISIVEKQIDQGPRPITCISEFTKVYLDNSYQMFSPRANYTRRIRRRSNTIN